MCTTDLLRLFRGKKKYQKSNYWDNYKKLTRSVNKINLITYVSVFIYSDDVNGVLHTIKKFWIWVAFIYWLSNFKKFLMGVIKKHIIIFKKNYQDQWYDFPFEDRLFLVDFIPSCLLFLTLLFNYYLKKKPKSFQDKNLTYSFA